MLIYKHTSKTSGKSYIGMTKHSMEDRFKRHCYEVQRGSNTHFHNAIRKYGKEDFISEIVEEFNYLDIEFLKEREIYWVEYFDTYNKGYNSDKGGWGGAVSGSDQVKKRLETITKNDFWKKEIGKKISETKNSWSKEYKKEIYEKRNKTISEKDPNFLKNIGKKSSETQKRNGCSEGRNNGNFDSRKMLLIDDEGNIVTSFLKSEIENLPIEGYPPKRSIWYSIQKHRPMFVWNDIYSPYHKWTVCPEDEIWCDMNVKMKNRRR